MMKLDTYFGIDYKCLEVTEEFRPLDLLLHSSALITVAEVGAQVHFFRVPAYSIAWLTGAKTTCFGLWNVSQRRAKLHFFACLTG